MSGPGSPIQHEDFGYDTPVRVWTDSSAALGISTRSGLGKLRHLETHTLWVLEKVRTGAIQVRKVRGVLRARRTHSPNICLVRTRFTSS